MFSNFFATTAKGIEDVLSEEIKRLGIRVTSVATGGVGFTGDLRTCYLANLWLRTAQRILIPLATFDCETPQQLYDGIRSVDWDDYISPDNTIAVDSNVRDSRMTHSGFVALKTKDAIVDQLRDCCGRRPNVDVRDPDVRINIHVSQNRCTVGLDSSGTGLDKRGYRTEAGEAPLRETLAAAAVELSGWDGASPLIDPMCGSGTICIEAAFKRSLRPPGLLRKYYGFQRWLSFDRSLWMTLLQEAEGQVVGNRERCISGCDISGAVLRKARANAARARVEHDIVFKETDFTALEPVMPPGVLIFNPPYGVRLGELDALKHLYRRIGDTLKRSWKGYTAFVLTGNPELGKSIGLKPSRRIVLFNGPIECRLLKYELY